VLIRASRIAQTEVNAEDSRGPTSGQKIEAVRSEVGASSVTGRSRRLMTRRARRDRSTPPTFRGWPSTITGHCGRSLSTQRSRWTCH